MRGVPLIGVIGWLLLQPSMLAGTEALTLKISPATTVAPAVVNVQVTIAADDENRSLVIIAESAEFYTSSEITLDGRHAPRVSTVEFRSLPTGLYDVTGILMGPRGPRATALRRLQVARGVGQR